MRARTAPRRQSAGGAAAARGYGRSSGSVRAGGWGVGERRGGKQEGGGEKKRQRGKRLLSSPAALAEVCSLSSGRGRSGVAGPAWAEGLRGAAAPRAWSCCCSWGCAAARQR